MTKFKKCDYCKRSANKFFKLKSRKGFLEGRGKVVQQKSNCERKEVPVVLHLCKICYDYLAPKESTRLDDEKESTEYPELHQLFTEKSTGEWRTN